MSDSPTGPDLVVRFAKQGYVTNFRVVSISSGDPSTVQAALSPIGRVVAIDPTQPQTVADDRTGGLLNATIAFQANSLPTATSVEITTYVQGDPGYADVFPGQFVGIQGGVPGPLESFSIAAITARDAAGDEVQLDPSKPATLSIPVSPAHDPILAEIPLWRLNESTGIWEQVAVATRGTGVPVVYTAQITHLSTFNIDIYREAAGLKVIAVDYSDKPELASIDYPNGSVDIPTLNGLPRLPGVWVQVSVGGWAGSGNTDLNGELVLSPPTGTRLFTFMASKLSFKDFRTFNLANPPSGQATVYVGLCKDASWPPPVTGDVGAIVN
jgi:hypothetical protein